MPTATIGLQKGESAKCSVRRQLHTRPPHSALPEPHALKKRGGRPARFPEATQPLETRCMPALAEEACAASLNVWESFPSGTPLFYTALQSPPERLDWDAIPGAVGYRALIGIVKPDGCIVPIKTSAMLSERHCSLSLRCMALRPGVVYAWQVEPLGTNSLYHGGEDVVRKSALRWEGRFWLLDAERAARLRRGRQMLEQVADPDVIAIALALLMAELELYHDALHLIKKGPAHAVRPTRVLLAHIVQAMIYQQMSQHLEQEQLLPPHFQRWTLAQEQQHRQEVAVHMADAAAPKLPAEISIACRPFDSRRLVASPTRHVA